MSHLLLPPENLNSLLGLLNEAQLYNSLEMQFFFYKHVKINQIFFREDTLDMTEFVSGPAIQQQKLKNGSKVKVIKVSFG
jgi:hypothetical protein